MRTRARFRRCRAAARHVVRTAVYARSRGSCVFARIFLSTDAFRARR